MSVPTNQHAIESSEVNELIQKLQKSTTRLTLVGSNELEVENSSKKDGQTFRVDLRHYSSTPLRQTHKSGFFNGVNLLLYLLTVTIVVPIALFTLAAKVWVLFGFIVIVGTIFTLLATIEGKRLKRASYDVFVYESHSGAGYNLVIHAAQPNSETVESFRKNLESKIRSCAIDPYSRRDESTLSGQISQLHKLFQQGLLDEGEFKVAKARLLEKSGETERRIGFAGVDS